MVERARRLRVRPSQPGLRGPRETLPGPTTWVRPATGWWGRMNAGESPRNQGRTVWAPLSVSRRRSRGLRKTPQWGAERRAGPRHGSAIPSADGMGLAARQTNGRGVPRLRISALRYPHLEGRRVRNRQFGTTVRRDAPRGNAPARFNNVRRRMMSKSLNRTSAQTCDARLLRFARNDVDGLVDAVIARSAQRDEAISAIR